MKRPQWIAVGLAILLVAGLYIATSSNLFGSSSSRKPAVKAGDRSAGLSIDSLVAHAKTHMAPSQINRIHFLETSAQNAPDEEKIHLYHQIAGFWRDTMKPVEPDEWFMPYAWYTAEAARLENSEKSLTFAAHLLLKSLQVESKPELKLWQASQAKDLFQRSLKLNPGNDSSKVGLGAVILYGNMGGPMEGIQMIRSVTEKDSNNVYAQKILADASLESGQLDKASERFKTVARLQPDNMEAILRVADIAEQKGNKKEAIEWYSKLLPLIKIPEMRKEVEARIATLKN